MKYILCIGDGMADWPLPDYNQKTPLQVAHTPALDALVARGRLGLVHTVSPKFEPGSDVANLGILGYDPTEYYTGRAPIEAAALGLTIGDNQIACRCNLVTIQEGRMVSFTADHIDTDQANTVIQALNTAFANRAMTFHTGVSYRHSVIMPKHYANAVCVPPHNITDQLVGPHQPTGPHSDELCQIMAEAAPVVAAAGTSATDIWLWSQGPATVLPSFQSKTGLTGGLVTAVDLLKGLGKLAGLTVPNIPGATGFVDTDYAAKWQAAETILHDHDVVVIHVEAPDECGHLGDAALKISAITDFDHQIVQPALQYQATHPDTRIMVLPDHPTPCKIKTHSREPVPVVIAGPGIAANDQVAYSEPDAKRSGWVCDTPWGLLTEWLRQ